MSVQGWAMPCPSCGSRSVTVGVKPRATFARLFAAPSLADTFDEPVTSRCLSCNEEQTGGVLTDAELRGGLSLALDPLQRTLGALVLTRKHELRRAVYRLDLARERFEHEPEAARWTRDHDWRADKPAHDLGNWRYEQRPAGRGPWRNLVLDPGVTAHLDGTAA